MDKDEIKKCKDAAYFYENYVTVNGKKKPLTDNDRHILDLYSKGKLKVSPIKPRKP